jgi:hypothetical protein
MADKVFNVKNRSAGIVVYRIPEDGIRREFAPGETKRIAYSELEKLSYQSGGTQLIAQYLQVQSDEALDELAVHREPEYKMSEQDVVNLIKGSDNVDEFLDCLDFAPDGIIDLIRTLAVKLPMENTAKKKALKEKTGFDVDAALKNIEAEKEEEAAKKPAASPSGRRVQPAAEKAEPAAPTRRTTPKYNVVKKS